MIIKQSEKVVMEQIIHSLEEDHPVGDPPHGSIMPSSGNRNSDYDSLQIESSREWIPETLNEKPTLGKGCWHIWQLWKWEILASLLSVVSLVLVVIILVIENGRPLDDWAWSIGPTAMISFAATISKASLLVAVSGVIGQLKWQNFYGQTNSLFDLQLFDDSTRGPLGAAALIWHKNIKATLASLAAVVIITSLLVDPFIQLVFDFPTLSKLTPDEVGTFQKTTIYDPSGNFDDLFLTSYAASFVSERMQSAIIQAVLSETPSSLTASCSTGNCTWTEISTLAVCGDCTNVTARVRIICPKPDSHCDYYLPSGSNMSGTAFEKDGNIYMSEWNSSAKSLYQSSQKLGSLASITSFDAVQLNAPFQSETVLSHQIYLLSHPTAWSCSMSFCSKTYASIGMKNGVVIMSDPRVRNLVNVGTTSNYTTPFPFDTQSSLLHLQEEASINSSSIEYIINKADYSNIANYLTEIFSTDWAAGGFVASNKVEGVRSPNFGWKLAMHDLALVVQRMAEHMTEAIRTSRNSTLDVVQASRTKAYIRVYFAWLALPIAITVLSFVLVTWVVLGSGRDKLPTLKNSNLVLLAYEIDGWAPEDLVRQGEAALTNKAKDVKVTLPTEYEGTRFVRVGYS
ncbi:hypothetical protein F5Y14DRAFT_462004 [Nemania sp. NC0429]|nr:hypothetical protein F5Y14DRAFT_462004 [Nemania sp. NC0429]